MHDEHETLGVILKEAREKVNITVEKLAARTGITERYIYRIENEGKKPSYDVLYKLIRALSISADTIFYPERNEIASEMEDLLRILCRCDKRFLTAVKTTVEAMIDAVDQLPK